MPNTFTVNLYPVPAPGKSGERLTVSSTPVGFSTTWYDEDTKFVAVDVQANDVYVTFDGSTPTSSNGHRMYAGEGVTWSSRLADAAIFVAVSSDSKIQASPLTV